MGAAGSGVGRGTYRPLLSAAPIGLERRTTASGSRDRPNLRTQQSIAYVHTKRIKSAECVLTTVASIDIRSGTLWVAIPQFPPIGILG
ncbi:hypothetical protein UY3_00282 [Chelonia mydas]|uniref:Uncharacterized protein n=1 Tax=Chelonia mydas TaxID=8469 RepID=M7CCK5_CHEMY|nr:hypothetical protein UY3_00282 [Chelonia mydas]